MYTLLLIVIVWSHNGSSDSVTATHFEVPPESCDKTAKLLASQSTNEIAVKAFCIPKG